MTILLEADGFLAETLAPAISPDTLVVTDVVALRRALADQQVHDLVVIGPDVDMTTIADFAATERITRPTLGVVLVRRRVDTTTLKDAIRAGVREVVKLDDLTGLTEACESSLELTRQVRGDADVRSTSSGRLGQLVTVFSAKGGCGKTTVSTNLAATFAKMGRRVCLVDLDLAFGDVAIALQLFPDRGIADLAARTGRLDRTAVAGVVTNHSLNLDAVLAPVEPGAAENVSADLIGELLQLLKGMYDVVVVDTPPAFTDQVLTAFDASDHMALLTTLDIPALKNLKISLETLELLGYSRDRFHVVLNRADSKVGLAIEDVQRTLNAPIAAQLPSSRAVPAAINRGTPIVHDAPNHPVSQAVRKFAERLLQDSTPVATKDEAPARRRVLSLRRKQDLPA
jgi:pilus assembly protein CpaE